MRSRYSPFALVILLACLLNSLPSGAAARRSLVPEDYYARQEIGGVQVSPDGKSVAYIIVTIDKQTNRKIATLWLDATAGTGQPRRITDGRQPVAMPKWSPDGGSIAFLSLSSPGKGLDRPVPQVELWSVSRGTARQVTQLKNGVLDFDWSPDGGRLVCVSTSTIEQAPLEVDESTDLLYETHPYYKEDGKGYLPDSRQHLWIADVKTGQGTQLTDGDAWNDTQPAWSPNGRLIAFVSNRSGHAFDGSRDAEVWVVPATGGMPVKVSTHSLSGWMISGFAPMHSAPAWSPDSREVAFLAQREDGGAKSIWVGPADGRAPARDVVNYVDVNTKTFVWRGRDMYYVDNVRGARQVFKASAASGSITQLSSGERSLDDLAVDAKADTLVYTASDFNHPEDVYASDGHFAREHQLTHLGAGLLAQVRLCALTRVPFTAADGLHIDGFLARPNDWNDGRKHPLVLSIHGGPDLMAGYQWAFDLQVLCGRGYAVFFTNPRGSSGYGGRFLRAVDDQWGGTAFTDIMSGISLVLARNAWIDAAHMGVVGGSYGGYMTNWIISHTHRFAAAIPESSLSDLVSSEGASSQFYDLAPYFGGDVFARTEEYWKYSPLRYADKVATPTLIVHGENDNLVPLEQAEEWFRALRHFGVPAALVILPGEHHATIFGFQPRHTVEVMRLVDYWFDKYLLNAASADPPAASLSRRNRSARAM